MAEVVAAFVGKPHRFRQAREVGWEGGLISNPGQSGGRSRLGFIKHKRLWGHRTWRAQYDVSSFSAARRNQVPPADVDGLWH
jgi:hypothetical protein